MKILVTGSAGFIGYHIVKKLLECGHEVVGADNLNNYYDVKLKYARLIDTGIDCSDIIENEFIQSSSYKNYRFIKLSIENRDKLSNLFDLENFEVICNLAAQAGVRYSIENPYTYIESNVVGFVNLLECSRKKNIKHFIYASSSSVYGMNSEVPYSESDRVDTPVSLYAATKRADELIAHVYSHLHHLPVTGLRFFTVYGPWGRPDMSPFLFLNSILHDRPINIFNNGDMYRDFTYIDDIVEGLFRVIETPLDSSETDFYYKIYNIGSSCPIKLMDFITELEQISGKTALKTFLPMQPGDVYQTYADISNLRNDVGFQTSFNLKEGISRFYEWYIDFYSN